MANSIEYAQIFQQALDDQMIQELTTGWMELNAGMVQYNGGNTVKIPKISTTGLGDYSRSSGFNSGDVTLTFETHTFDKDRSSTFNLDSQDVDESNFVATASNVMSQFQRTEVVPEVDAYRYSKIFSLANAALKTQGYTAASSTIFEQLKADIAAVQDVVGENEPLVIAMGFATAGILDLSDKISHELSIDQFAVGEDSMGKPISAKVRTLDGIPIVRVSSSRFKSEYDFSATDGFSPATDALDLNWIIMARRSVIAVVKQDKMRIYDPDTNQTADAWKMDYRKYHSLWIPDNKLDGILVNYAISAAPALSITVAGGTASGSTKYTATAGGGNTLAYKVSTVADDGTVGIKPTGVTAYTSGADIAGVTAGEILNTYELDANGLIVKFTAHTLLSGDITA